MVIPVLFELANHCSRESDGDFGNWQFVAHRSGCVRIASQRASYGALQSRFETTVNNLQSTSENMSASRSRIQDADFAAETAALSRAQILQQAGTAMVAQANQLPQGVLALLRGSARAAGRRILRPSEKNRGGGDGRSLPPCRLRVNCRYSRCLSALISAMRPAAWLDNLPIGINLTVHSSGGGYG